MDEQCGIIIRALPHEGPILRNLLEYLGITFWEDRSLPLFEYHFDPKDLNLFLISKEANTFLVKTKDRNWYRYYIHKPPEDLSIAELSVLWNADII